MGIFGHVWYKETNAAFNTWKMFEKHQKLIFYETHLYIFWPLQPSLETDKYISLAGGRLSVRRLEAVWHKSSCSELVNGNMMDCGTSLGKRVTNKPYLKIQRDITKQHKLQNKSSNHIVDIHKSMWTGILYHIRAIRCFTEIMYMCTYFILLHGYSFLVQRNSILSISTFHVFSLLELGFIWYQK